MAERVTRAEVREISLDDQGSMALITLDNGATAKPNTFGPQGLAELYTALSSVTERAHRGEITAVAITGQVGNFAAGADLHQAASLGSHEAAADIARRGHDTYRLLLDMPVPTFAYVSGPALGGGLELALSCQYRTVMSSVRNLGLPEVGLGLIPGWGGTFLLPRLIGIDRAIEVILDNPLRGNTQLDAGQATQVGLMDLCLDEAGFLTESVQWTRDILRGQAAVARPPQPDGQHWHAAVEAARHTVAERLHGASPAATAAVDLLAQAGHGDREASFAAEEAALARLLTSAEFAASMYAFELTNRRSRTPVGAPPAQAARTPSRIGIIGAGLMASQLALLFASRLEVPVVMRDIDAARAEQGRSYVQAEVERLSDRGRLRPDAAQRISSLVSATDDLADLAGADFVIEAVTEQMPVKQEALTQLSPYIHPEMVIASNTSALSLTEMASVLPHPERMVGLHFFNPVSRMPLVEVVRTDATDEPSYATAFAIAQGCRKTAVAVADRPGFIVNRLLLRLLGEVLGSLEEGTTVRDADLALQPLGLPMGPFQLLQLVGPAVAHHVLVTLRSELGDRYPTSPGLAAMVDADRAFVHVDHRPSATSAVDLKIGEYFGSRPGSPQRPDELLHRVRTTLAAEIELMLSEGVAQDRGDIDLAMIMGAGWPFHLGGITPYLERTGALDPASG